MKREIKFRAWDVETERMFDPYFFEPNPDANNYRCYEDWRELEDGRFAVCELMQFSGLYDSRGVEIYEGDIVKDWDGESHEITFKDGSFGIFFDGGTATLRSTAWEVIGNVHENPDLLGVAISGRVD